MFNKLQYISQGNTIQEQIANIHQALDNGCDWIQMRFKNNTTDCYKLAEATKFLCTEYLATFIVNDNVALAAEVNADGVHLGLQDMPITQARDILGKTKIIGATANTLQQVLQQIEHNCDYIGLGPYQFTTTKQNLSPVLGIIGYTNIIKTLQKQNCNIPIYAIGGITLKDITPILETGIYGIAVSGLITNADNPKELITQLNEKLYVTI